MYVHQCVYIYCFVWYLINWDILVINHSLIFACLRIAIWMRHATYMWSFVPTNSVSLHTARKIFIYLLTYLLSQSEIRTHYKPIDFRLLSKELQCFIHSFYVVYKIPVCCWKHYKLKEMNWNKWWKQVKAWARVINHCCTQRYQSFCTFLGGNYLLVSSEKQI